MSKSWLLLLVTFGVAIYSFAAFLPSTQASNDVLAVHAICRDLESSEPVFEGRLEAAKGTLESGSDSAVIIDEAGVVYETRGFGLSGEVVTVVPGYEFFSRRIELGAPRDVDGLEGQVLECFVSEVKTETRELTADDVEQLSLDHSLIGTSADFESSLHGIAWLVLPTE